MNHENMMLLSLVLLVLGAWFFSGIPRRKAKKQADKILRNAHIQAEAIREQTLQYVKKQVREAKDQYFQEEYNGKKRLSALAGEADKLQDKIDVQTEFLEKLQETHPEILETLAKQRMLKAWQGYDQLRKSNAKTQLQDALNEMEGLRKEIEWKDMLLTKCRSKVPELEAWMAGRVVDHPGIVDLSYAGNEPAGYYLAEDEREELSVPEQLSLALSRYYSSVLPYASIGRLYEIQVGTYYEAEGWMVEFHGIREGLEDGGVDLIARKDGETLLIQCKCWSEKQGKLIHSNVVHQLHGARDEYVLKHPDEDVEAIIFATVDLDPRAEEASKALSIFSCLFPADFRHMPQARGVVEPQTGEKVYVTPLDASFGVLPGKNFSSPAEAEKAGFSRKPLSKADCGIGDPVIHYPDLPPFQDPLT